MKSIRRQLLMRLLLGLLLLLGVAGTALFFRTRAILQADFDAALRAKALALVSLTKPEQGQVEMDFAGEFMTEFERRSKPEYFQAWLPDGTTLERSPSLAGAELPRRAGSLARPVFWNLKLPDGRAGRAIGLRFIVEPEEEHTDSYVPQTRPEVTLVLARDRIALNRTLAGFQLALALVGVLSLAATALIIRVVVRQGLAPLARVGEQAAAIDAASLHTRFLTESLPRELRPISQRLNDLLARLEQSFERERQFTADAAHELRTPIAELRTLAEVALKWPEGTDATNQSFRDALEIAKKMEAIATGLLSLARYEAGKQTLEREPVAVRELVDEIWRPLAAQAGRRQLRVSFEIPPNIRLATDRALFSLVLANLFSNAVEY
ncbi:MAG: histidine kinase dimerization/phospho-acceptor domain-containing protein, partial [Verrucomicrobiia bacterium]